MPLTGAVEIDEMKRICSLLNPTTRHGGGIVAEDGFLSVIALPQPYALAASQIDGRQDEHGREPPIGTRIVEDVSRHCRGRRRNLQESVKISRGR
jgi:hypothetical protein